jgi:hypothetical protein
MSDFSDKLKLKEQAEEDIWFARRDRELIEAMRRRRPRSAGHAGLRVVSGGQTGVDRAALDAAMEAGLRPGGWCPAGRRAEDGPIPARYSLLETPSSAYAQRTEWNARDSDATLILHRGPLSGGTRLTAELAARYERPVLMLDLAGDPSLDEAAEWIRRQGIRVLNVAGPREEHAPGIYADARDFLSRLFPLCVRAGEG